MTCLLALPFHTRGNCPCCISVGLESMLGPISETRDYLQTEAAKEPMDEPPSSRRRPAAAIPVDATAAAALTSGTRQMHGRDPEVREVEPGDLLRP